METCYFENVQLFFKGFQNTADLNCYNKLGKLSTIY